VWWGRKRGVGGSTSNVRQRCGGWRENAAGLSNEPRWAVATKPGEHGRGSPVAPDLRKVVRWSAVCR